MNLGSSGEPTLPILHKKWLKELGLTLDFIVDAKIQVVEETEIALEMFV